MENDVEEFVFGMKCTFEIKCEDPRRKNRNCKRMSGTEYGKKWCKKQTSPEPRNKSNRVQMAADHKKMNKQCVNDEKKTMPLAVNKISDKTFVNEMEVMPVQDGRGIKEERKN